ncbi:hypothetical protein JNW90_26600 [Micromonospora sp. STR1s_5]|nr:hypothetical protein [Micromonospora sp. STR1s_5]
MPDRTVIAARSILSSTPIDGGDKLAMEMEEGAAGQMLSVLIPTSEVARLNDLLGAALIQAAAAQASRND